MSATNQASTLRAWSLEAGPLDEALATVTDLLGADPLLLAYAPSSLIVAPLTPGATLALGSDPADVSVAYEARAFGSRAELRWRAGERSVLVAMSEDSAQYADRLEEVQAARVTVVDSLETSYLCWGSVEGRTPDASTLADGRGWWRLWEARIGPLDLPLRGEWNRGDRVALRATELIALDVDEHGNAAVVDELLRGLAKAETPSWSAT